MRKGWIVLSLVLCILLSACKSISVERDEAPGLTESAYLAETQNKEGAVSGTVPLYYTNASATSLVEIQQSYDFSDMGHREIVNAVMEDLKHIENVTSDELKDLTLQPILPEGVLDSVEEKVEAGSFDTEKMGERHIIEVRMTKLYYDMTLNEKVVLRAGLSRTIFSLGIADRIDFMAPSQNEEKESSMVQVNSSSSEDKLIINQYSRYFYTDEVKVKLYFGNEDGTALRQETRTLTLGMTDPLPTAIMKALIEGPESDGMTSVIPQGTMIEDVFIKDGVCYVDLSAEFQKNHLGGEMAEQLTIYSIVNSLQDVGNIQYVQFLIEGKKMEYYKSYVKIDTLLTSNGDLVES